ncbi:sodium/potassium-transporting ATPase subunit beta-1-interacting protein 4 isoform X1 [Mesocricetus auratus]|uniref:Sodium/potassium-transporting ATPase subunit beta-1-interacting protein n=1 Tax=Mesocricetus auratus TaxID=10036 RepID=A0ABM2WD67_MESAU|nr:sodium/potassium-transporting ATPase subunit beta-1-interacting protein 4 isoform X1 [Mesocricetus auratus]XP_040588849.1 sodium/potassium-transporting ATPase subunit beta-1-interacting protein 4 isoform X1 [Mesocricetus auratus]
MSSLSASTWKWGGLSKDSELLTFNLSRHRSWWEEHGPGCLHKEAATVGLGAMHGQSLVVDAGCTMAYSYMEALHSGLQILLAGRKFKAQEMQGFHQVHTGHPHHPHAAAAVRWLDMSGLLVGVFQLLGFVYGCYVVSVLTEEEDSFDFIGGFDPFPLYHVNEKPSSLLSKQAYLPA